MGLGLAELEEREREGVRETTKTTKSQKKMLMYLE